MNRAELNRIATNLFDPEKLPFGQAAGPEGLLPSTVVAISEWARHGAQSVELPHTYAAALMATDAHEALEGQPLPWPAFEIKVPAGLLTFPAPRGDVFSVIVAAPTGGAPWRLLACYFDAGVIGERAFSKPDLKQLFDAEHLASEERAIDPDIGALYDAKLDTRTWTMLSRLIAGVVLAITQARERTPELYGPRKLRIKHAVLHPNTHRVGVPLTIDCRAHVRDFVLGIRRTSPTVQTLVRGHWRRQPYGTRSELRRVQWIAPFFRGEGALISRPVRLREPDPTR